MTQTQAASILGTIHAIMMRTENKKNEQGALLVSSSRSIATSFALPQFWSYASDGFQRADSQTHVKEERVMHIHCNPQLSAGEEFSHINVRAITLWQPWASLIALTLKRYETRSWSTSFRGKLLIHAAARKPIPAEKRAIASLFNKTKQFSDTKQYEEIVELLVEYDFPLGSVVAIADLTKCLQMINGWVETNPEPGQTVIQAKSPLERAVGDWTPGRFAWRLENIQALPKPIACKGKQGLWIPTGEVIEQVKGAA